MLNIPGHKGHASKKKKKALRFYLTPVRMLSRTQMTRNVGEEAGGKGILIHCWWECKLVQPLWKTVQRLLKKVEIDLPYDPAIPLLRLYPNKCNTGYSRGTCTPMFIVALLTIAKLWKQPRCPPTDEWIKKMWYLYTMEFYLATKKNETLSFADKWMELENIILSEVSQAQKAKSCMFSLKYGI
jgi:hypothetical protein